MLASIKKLDGQSYIIVLITNHCAVEFWSRFTDGSPLPKENARLLCMTRKVIPDVSSPEIWTHQRIHHSGAIWFNDRRQVHHQLWCMTKALHAWSDFSFCRTLEKLNVTPLWSWAKIQIPASLVLLFLPSISWGAIHQLLLPCSSSVLSFRLGPPGSRAARSLPLSSVISNFKDFLNARLYYFQTFQNIRLYYCSNLSFCSVISW